MDIIVTEKNVPQIVQALYENVKSNQHRLNTLEPLIRDEVAPQVQKLFILLHENGYATAVKQTAIDLGEFRGEFTEFLKVRLETCPTMQAIEAEQEAQKEDLKEKRARKQWRITVFRAGIATIALIPTVILIVSNIRS